MDTLDLLCAATALVALAVAATSLLLAKALLEDARADRRHHEARIDAMLTRQQAIVPPVAVQRIAPPARGDELAPRGEDFELRLQEQLRKVEEITGIDQYGDPLPA